MASTTKNVVSKNKADGNIDLRELLALKIGILYGAESDSLKVLSVMARKSTDADLKNALERHAKETEDHVKRLLQVCGFLGIKPKRLPSGVLKGLSTDLDTTLKGVKNAAAIDASFVAAARSIECYEVACYEVAIAWAKLLEKDDVADLLEQNLEEEDAMNEMLGDLAELKIDERALPEGFERGEEDDEDDDEDEEEEEVDEDEKE